MKSARIKMSSMASTDGAAKVVPPVTGEDLPTEVRALLKSYALKELRWAVPEHRHAIVGRILTRGDSVAEHWLWTHCSRESVKTLLRRFGGAGFDDEDRDVLRKKLDLTEQDLPARPFGAMRWRG